jgi:hypothetical protein
LRATCCVHASKWRQCRCALISSTAQECGHAGIQAPASSLLASTRARCPVTSPIQQPPHMPRCSRGTSRSHPQRRPPSCSSNAAGAAATTRASLQQDQQQPPTTPAFQQQQQQQQQQPQQQPPLPREPPSSSRSSPRRHGSSGAQGSLQQPHRSGHHGRGGEQRQQRPARAAGAAVAILPVDQPVAVVVDPVAARALPGVAGGAPDARHPHLQGGREGGGRP